MTSSYPRLLYTLPSGVSKPRRCTSIPSIPLPKISLPPKLPSPPRPQEFAPGYTVTTHLVPSAYPRYSYKEYKRYLASSLEVLDNPPIDTAPKASRRQWAEDKCETFVRKREEFHRARANPSPQFTTQLEPDDGPVLWNVINRYARTQDSRDKRDFGLTIVVCHANGLHKETWEPTFRHLIELSQRKRTGICIDEIWSIDAANTGDSALVNKGKLGDTFDWIDHARDILNFVENYIPAGPYDPFAHHPTHLEAVHPAIAESRATSGFADRHLVGLAHSFGGCSMANAACARPNLFLSLTLVDPVILPDATDVRPRMMDALTRRQSWPSRTEAKTIMQQNPFFGAWHPDVLDAFVNYALYEVVPGGEVRLKMDRFQEAAVFSDGYTRRETWDLLETLDEQVKLRWIMAGKPTIGTPEVMQKLVWRRIVNSSNVIIEKSGHLIAQEAPLELAKETLFGWRVMLAETQDPIWARLKL